ncbi:MAG: hypothetical protein DHS20C12_22470 [Pseudohongiella sp.]|nr:MAG: hypothetical protein DHS20C12_22470 [Pseudohongiella sp.]
MTENKKQGFDELFLEKPESIEELIENMNTDVYDSLKLAIELGKWGDGSRLNPEQIEFCMQAIILFEAKHLAEEDRIGFDLSASCKSKSAAEPVEIIGLNGDGKGNRA